MFLISERKCAPPTPSQDGFIKISNFQGQYTVGSLATYHCRPGFTLVGNSLRSCTENGEWNGTTPMCQKGSCGDPPAIENTAMEVLDRIHGTVVTYSCLPGFTSTGGHIEFQSSCFGNRSWSDAGATCIRIPDISQERYLLPLFIGGICLIISISSLMLLLLHIFRR